MVRFEGELYPLSTLMEAELKIEMGEGMYAMRGCLYINIFYQGQIIEGTDPLGSRCQGI